MGKPELSWLPIAPDWIERIKNLERSQSVSWDDLVRLAGANLDFLRTERLDKLLRAHFGAAPPPDFATQPVRLGLLGSSTLVQLHAGLRVAALRRGIWLSIHETGYGQYYRELIDPGSALHGFAPTVVLLALDARHLTAGIQAHTEPAAAGELEAGVLARLRQCWDLARTKFGASVVQQSVLPVLPRTLGNNESRLAASAARLVDRLNAGLREAADEAGVSLLDIAARAAQDGIRHWHDPVLWHRAKQEISPIAGPVYGDLFARLLAALQGRSSKCLVLDLDDTLWGGVIGDDGIEGIALGQGSAEGEAFAEMQSYALQLSRRGVILAVCSKNDEANALQAFDTHPEMVLRRRDIASFVANWDDKATNLRRIARELNIGLESLVFVDDNPFERNLIRRELPQVAVPEIPDDDPAFIPRILADAGYFEQVAVTGDDLVRGSQYQADRERAAARADVADLPAYLRGLEMRMLWSRFDARAQARIVQLMNKTNQFNLRTRRYTGDEIAAIMADDTAFGIHIRLVDRYGDNGIVALVVGRLVEGDCFIETWLMSCRVLGRQLEEATLGVVVAEARRRGAKALVGEYVPTAKNAMVAGHYARLGFSEVRAAPDGGTTSRLDLDGYDPPETFIAVAAIPVLEESVT